MILEDREFKRIERVLIIHPYDKVDEVFNRIKGKRLYQIWIPEAMLTSEVRAMFMPYITEDGQPTGTIEPYFTCDITRRVNNGKEGVEYVKTTYALGSEFEFDVDSFYENAIVIAERHSTTGTF